MTDSSSKEMAEMAAELLSTQLESAKREGQLTHVLKLGTFHLEIVPDDKIDIDELFTKTLVLLMNKYDDKLLNININQLGKDGQVHYG
tara:strand:- start:519 stop:782 length:264 start_codon:yes stop_codon:yes gene_type:complete